jgi:gluconokinase
MSQQVLIMGVSGCGKTTVGKMLADELGAVFYDADDFHPAANRDKMSRGIPLDEEDRKPWLQSIAETIRTQNQTFVLACSALRESYRQQLLAACPRLQIVHLHGSRELFLERMQQRQGHFMPASLLDSQLATLETPAAALRLDITASPKELTALIRKHLSA